MLEGYQRKHLKQLAHGLKPVVFVGQKGLSPEVIKFTDDALKRHELIKLKFIAVKEKQQKNDIVRSLCDQTGADTVGTIGHTVILFRQHPDPKKRRIAVPNRKHPVGALPSE